MRIESPIVITTIRRLTAQREAKIDEWVKSGKLSSEIDLEIRRLVNSIPIRLPLGFALRPFWRDENRPLLEGRRLFPSHF